MNGEDRASLGRRAQAGDARALESLLLDCRPDLTRYARRSCASEDVDDAVQDALLIVQQKFGTLRTMAALAGWLFAVARHACLRLARSRRSDVRRYAPLDDARDQQALAPDPDLRLDLARVIAGLPHDYREALVLRDIEGLSAEAAAARLNLLTPAFKSRLHRARALVRAEMSPRPPRPPLEPARVEAPHA